VDGLHAASSADEIRAAETAGSGYKEKLLVARRRGPFAAEAAVAQVLADHPIGADQQAHEGLALAAERVPRSRRRPDGRPALRTRNRGRCDASTQVPGPDLQRLQAFYRWEQHSKADGETPESPVFAGNVSVGSN
jgi:hypothetical protein